MGERDAEWDSKAAHVMGQRFARVLGFRHAHVASGCGKVRGPVMSCEGCEQVYKHVMLPEVVVSRTAYMPA